MDPKTKSNVARAVLGLTGPHGAVSLHDDLRTIVIASGLPPVEAVKAISSRVMSALEHDDAWHGIAFLSPVLMVHHMTARLLSTGGPGLPFTMSDIGAVIASELRPLVLKDALSTLAEWAESES